MLQHFILLMLLGVQFIQAQETEGGSYWDIRLSPNSIASVPFGDGHITVWQQADKPGRFYAMPLVLLLQNSANTRYNVLLGKHEMIFDVQMWSVEVREAVYRHLKAARPNLAIQNVEMLPMEKVRLVWRGHGSQDAFQLDNKWNSNTHLPAVLTFRYFCNDGETCNQLAQAMKTTPDMFLGLELEYVINGHKSARRQVTVTGNSIATGKLFSQIENMQEASSSRVRFINSADLRTLASESTRNVIAIVVTESNYVDAGDEISVSNMMHGVFSQDEVSTSTFTPHMWKSVFWNPSWARPDNVAEYLNKSLQKDAADDRNFLLRDEAKLPSYNVKVGGWLLKIMVSGGKQKKVRKEDLLNVLNEEHSNVEWTGEAFRVKPMKLYRLNLSTLKASTSIAVANLQIHRYESVQSISVRLTPSVSLTPSLTPQLVEARLMKKTDELSSKLEQLERVTKTHNTAAGKAINALNEADANLAARINTSEKRQQTPAWPGGSYCIWSGPRGCPAGFKQVSGYMRALNMHIINRKSLTQVWMGASNIKCHYNNCSNKLADLNIVICCK